MISWHLYLYPTHKEARDAFRRAAELTQMDADVTVNHAELVISEGEGSKLRYMSLENEHDLLRLIGYRPTNLWISPHVDADLAHRAVSHMRVTPFNWV